MKGHPLLEMRREDRRAYTGAIRNQQGIGVGGEPPAKAADRRFAGDCVHEVQPPDDRHWICSSSKP
jgi:hypothetical protein